MTLASVARWLALLVAWVGLAGCHAPGPPVGPTREWVPVRFETPAETAEDVDVLWQAAGRTLERYYFRLDRQDRLAGVITTYPETTANWFEWWRPQPKSAYYWSEANLHSVQRSAKIHFRRMASIGACEVDVSVRRYKYNLPERQIDSAAAAMRLYSNVAPDASGDNITVEESAYWTDLGRDQGMEEILLEAIVDRYGQGVVPPPTSEAPSPEP